MHVEIKLNESEIDVLLTSLDEWWYNIVAQDCDLSDFYGKLKYKLKLLLAEEFDF